MAEKKKRFRVRLLTVHNIMGVGDEVEIKPGALTLIKGKNGLGKTSLIEAVRACLGKGHKATLLREGAEEGEVVVVLDDGSGPPYLTVSAKVTADNTTRKIGYPGEAPLPRPAEQLANIRNDFTLFPTEFLTKDKNERLALFLDAVPLKVNKEDLAGVLSLLPNKNAIDLNRHAFKVLSEIDQILRDKRKGVNAVVSEKRKTVTTLKAGLNTDIEDVSEAKTRFNDLKTRMDANRRTYESEIEINNAEFNIAKDELTSDYNSKMALLAADSKQQAQNLADAYQKSNLTVGAEVAKLEEQIKSFDRTTETRVLIANLNRDADEADDLSKALTQALDVDLKDIRNDLVTQVPIEGVTVNDGDICVDTPDGKAIPFDAVNTREKLRVAVDLALLKAGPLPLLLMDGAEALDQDSLDQLQELLEAKGAQLLASRVTEDPEMTITK
jgi:energy-coupling factor transporter ATP-binding protein EcfA2